MQFNKFLEISENISEIGSICIEENFLWAKQIKLPHIELGLPSIEKTSKISILNDRINPIYVQLKDGSKLFFTYDEFKRIQGTPLIGKTMHLTMQRLGGDTSDYPSKITSCRITD